MCSICHNSPCLARCPNADEPKAVYECNYCGEGIVRGEEYVEIEDKYFHKSCIEDSMTAREIVIDVLGCRFREAEDMV